MAPQPGHEPASRTALASLLVTLTVELSGCRQAYHVALQLLAVRTRELRELRGRYEATLEEYRTFRARVLERDGRNAA